MSDKELHRPPKYVDGVYKPHYADPNAEYVLMEASLLGHDFPGGLYWAQTDSGGDAKGVVRDLDGKPITEGADSVIGWVYDGELELYSGEYIDYNDWVEKEHIPDLPNDD